MQEDSPTNHKTRPAIVRRFHGERSWECGAVNRVDAYAPKKRKRRPLRGLALLFLLVAIAAGAYYGWQNFVPNDERMKPVYESEHPIIYQGAVTEHGAIIEGETVKLPLGLLEQLLDSDPAIHYEEATESLILTTEQKVVYLKTDALTATMNQEPFELRFAVEKIDGIVYIPIDPLQELFGIQAEYHEGTSLVTVHLPGEAVQKASTVHEETALRSEPTIRAPIIELMASSAIVSLWGEEAGWYKAQTSAGYIGYIKKSDVALTGIDKVAELKREEPFIAWKVLGQKVNLTWEAVYMKKTDISKIGELEGVNVVSPTWFELLDEQGNIRSKADKEYVSWAHKKGMQVWALFSNNFKDPDITSVALSNYEARLKMIKQLLAYAQTYKLQGINIDFENVYTADKANLVQFVRELTPLLHEQGLVVSIDVTPKSNSEMWSLFLDREELGKVVDYMMLMAYDEHWASSPKSGSVASLPWVETSIKRILDEDGVPPHKLLLGIPLYTRIWTEEEQTDGTIKVSSKAVGMETVDKLVIEKKLTPVYQPEVGQHYVEYMEDGALRRIWIEDETSVKARAQLVKKYDLGGVATWQRAFQKPEIWPVLDDVLQSHP
ncbi:glycosyl hydrolase [Paenibacillaceae bacterium]|nr:glycosyl hydrolase [Paenibacillaceae bacterium]